jgi:hypothetical protein
MNCFYSLIFKTYSDYHTITRKCVTNAYRMVVSILAPIGYTEPSPKEYLQLVITGRKAVTQGNVWAF